MAQFKEDLNGGSRGGAERVAGVGLTGLHHGVISISVGGDVFYQFIHSMNSH